MTDKQPAILAQVLLPSKDLAVDMDFFTNLGFRLEKIYPADSPVVAIMSGFGLNIRLDKHFNGPAPALQLLTGHDRHDEKITAPNGTRISFAPLNFELGNPVTQHKFEVRQLQDKEPWIIGRAGMLYRDLIPDRLGGSIIASHIRIPNGGPVPDMVHYHTIGFQLIYCFKGWVKLVYEDQGPPFILNAGDCVTQPPEIRHRVLEASDNLEVIEIGVPAVHMTTIDHEMELPTGNMLPDRVFKGQTFCLHIAKNSLWQKGRIAGFERRETGVNKATNGLASVQVVRPLTGISTTDSFSHNTDIYFSFVLKGHLELKAEGHKLETLKTGDAFVLPPGLPFNFKAFSPNLEILEVALPGNFKVISG